jgi:uncharacterized membrane protein YiaA
VRKSFFWSVLILGVIIFFIGIIILLTAAGTFADLGTEIDVLLGGMFSRILTLDILGRSMQEEWDRSVIVLQLIGTISILFGVILMGVGLTNLLSRDDWRRR